MGNRSLDTALGILTYLYPLWEDRLLGRTDYLVFVIISQHSWHNAGYVCVVYMKWIFVGNMKDKRKKKGMNLIKNDSFFKMNIMWFIKCKKNLRNNLFQIFSSAVLKPKIT